ncbi:hypothetical protein WJX72_010121 [[Myrmecia] bisecta]|uniref:Uncharacterized protein n=1 Tax=[Myrmecia] bisecta TaxID=41462 RepID=A0AAW1P545_9CHLO
MGKGMGKGKGKGGDNLWTEGQNCIHSISSCLCLLLFAGPVLIIVGIVFLASSTTDTRAQRINDFYAYKATWGDNTAVGYQGFKTAQFSARFAVEQAQGQAACSATNLALVGSADLQGGSATADTLKDSGVTNDYPQWKFALPLPASLSSAYTSGCQLKAEIFDSPASNSTRTPVASVAAVFVDSRTYTRSDLGSCSSKKHSQTACYADNCRSKYSGTYDSSKGVCTATVKLSGLCVKVTPDAGQPFTYHLNETTPATGDGCYWKANAFSPTSYAASSGTPAMVVYVRSAQDPYLKALAVTSGSLFFGLTQGQKRGIGLACLIIGLATLAFWVLVCIGCFKALRHARTQQQPPTGMVNGYFYNAAQR